MNLDGKVAIVTGGAQGIGRAYCEALLKHGCKVCVADANKEVGKKTAEELEKQHKGNVLFVRCDVTLFEEFDDAFRKTFEAFGGLDILVNNAGIVNEHDWKKSIEVNFIAVVQGIKLAFEYMGKDKGGSGGVVVNTASTAGLVPFNVNPVYSGTKHAVIGVTRGFGNDLYFKETGVKVSAVCPGGTDTPLSRTFHPFSLNEKEAKKITANYPWVQPSLIAEALIKILEDGRNGAALVADEKGIAYEEFSHV